MDPLLIKQVILVLVVLVVVQLQVLMKEVVDQMAILVEKDPILLPYIPEAVVVEQEVLVEIQVVLLVELGE